jgi:hypothetical protein
VALQEPAIPTRPLWHAYVDEFGDGGWTLRMSYRLECLLPVAILVGADLMACGPGAQPNRTSATVNIVLAAAAAAKPRATAKPIAPDVYYLWFGM